MKGKPLKNGKKLSPMMEFYTNLKESYKDAILLFRLGDFYEMFFEDAIKASQILDITLTGRDCGLEEKAPMCGVPYHAVDSYIAKLLAFGNNVAICEQVSDPKESKGMVDREVVRVITPGTIIEDVILDEKKNNYIANVIIEKSSSAIAWLDVSTGEFNAIELTANTNIIEDMLVTIGPAEILTNSTSYEIIKNIASIRLGKLPTPQKYVDSTYNYGNAYKKLTDTFKTQTLQIFECEGNRPIVSVAGSLMEYISETQKRFLCHITGINIIKNNNFMFLDTATRRNLEITQNSRDSKKYGSLLWVIDKTKTSMGARKLRNWLDQPLINSKKINLRLDGVEYLVENNALRTDLIDILSNIKDIERIISKIAYKTVNPRELRILGDSLINFPKIKNALQDINIPILRKVYDDIGDFFELGDLLIKAFKSDGKTIVREGDFINKYFNSDLDFLRNAKDNAKNKVVELQIQERELTGIKGLKISYNKVFGYYIEVSNSYKDLIPFRYIRKQTLTNAERYTTEELQELQEAVFGSDEKAVQLEIKIFNQMIETLLNYITGLKISANAISSLDALVSFAQVSLDNNYCKPVINDDIEIINIVKGRHPVVEKIIGFNQFVANDYNIDKKDNRTLIITGPNMAGKSTYMRSVAIITLLAHIGCFVPATEAKISITDRIFTRIGASDDLAFGQSTFMVEMTEVATIVNNATDSSLLILDEIGRGTSTCDGLAIAWAVIEYITNNFKTKTLFSTHYHELTELEGLLDGVKNYKIMIKELNDQVIFTHKVTRGGANKSFGIEVAKLAGLPKTVLDRANVISKKLEQNELVKDTNSILLDSKEIFQKDDLKQLSFFENSISDEVVEMIKKIDIDNLTPLQALQELCELKEKVRKIK